MPSRKLFLSITFASIFLILDSSRVDAQCYACAGHGLSGTCSQSETGFDTCSGPPGCILEGEFCVVEHPQGNATSPGDDRAIYAALRPDVEMRDLIPMESPLIFASILRSRATKCRIPASPFALREELGADPWSGGRQLDAAPFRSVTA